MKKRVLAILLIAALLIVFANTVFAATSPTFTAGDVQCKPGDQVTLDISISNNSNLGVDGVQLFLYYDDFFSIPTDDWDSPLVALNADTFRANTFTSNGSYPDIPEPSDNNGCGIIWASYNLVDIESDGVMFTITFDVSADATPGKYPVTFITSGTENVSKCNLNQVVYPDTEFVDGTITVLGPDITLDAGTDNNFGALTEGYDEDDAAAAAKTITITNTTDADITLDTTTPVALSDETNFTLDASGLGATIAAGESAEVIVTPKPGLTEGDYSVTVTVTDSAGETYTLDLTAKVEEPVQVKLDTPTVTLAASNANAGGLEVSWDEVTGAESYTVTIYDSTGTTPVKTFTGQTETSLQVDADITNENEAAHILPGTEYTATVIAHAEGYTDSGESDKPTAVTASQIVPTAADLIITPVGTNNTVVYDGNAKTVTAERKYTGVGQIDPFTVSYQVSDGQGGWTDIDAEPVDVGAYRAVADIEAVSGSTSYFFAPTIELQQFTITAAPLPAEASVTVDGTPTFGQTLRADVTGITPEAARAGLTYQWLRGDSAGGTFADITGATSASYELVQADVDKYIKVAVTGSGNYSGTKSTTTATAVARAEATLSITCTGYTYDGTTNPAPAPALYNGVAYVAGTDPAVSYTYYSDNEGYQGAALDPQPSGIFNAGTYWVRGTALATATHLEAVSAAVKFTVAKGTPTIAFNETADEATGKTIYGPAFTWTGSSVPLPTLDQLTITGRTDVTLDDIQFTYYDDTAGTTKTFMSMENAGGPPTNARPSVAYSVRATLVGNENWNEVTTSPYPTDAYAFYINKAAAPTNVTATVSVPSGTADTYTLNLTTASGWPEDIEQIVFGTPTKNGDLITAPLSVGGNSNVLTYDTLSKPAGTTAIITVPVQSYNYENFNVVVTVEAVDKTELTVSGLAAVDGLVYNGTAQTGVNATAITAKDGQTPVEIDWTWDVKYERQGATATDWTTITAAEVIDAGTYRVTYSIPASNTQYSGSQAVEFTISLKSLTDDMVSLSATSFTYDGNAKTPAVTVTDGTTPLTLTTDYTVTYSANTNAGTATATVTGIGNYSGEIKKTFTILPKAISDSTITVADIGNMTYTGTALTPASITVTDTAIGELGTVLTVGEDKDYTFTATNNTNAGTATVTVTGKGNYTSEITKTFTITAQAIEGAPTISGTPTFGQTLTADISGITAAARAGLTYQWLSSDSAGGPFAEITGATSASYELVQADVGKYIKVAVTGSGNYSGTKSTTTATAVAKAAATLSITCADYTYNGAVPAPAVAAYTGQGTPTYSYSYYANVPGTGGAPDAPADLPLATPPTDAGTYWVSGTAAETATHQAATSDKVKFRISQTVPTITVTIEGKESVPFGTPVSQLTPVATATYKNAAGEDDTCHGTIEWGVRMTNVYASDRMDWFFTPTDSKNFKGVGGNEVSVTVIPRSLTDSVITVDDIEDQPYTGSAIEPAVTVKNADFGSDYTLVQAGNYRLEYSDNVNAGTATVKIIGEDNLYTGEITQYFTITPRAIGGTVAIIGTTKYGQTLRAAGITPDGATLNYKWYRGNDASGYTAISGATSASYKLVKADVGKYIKVEVSGTGNYSGTQTSDAFGPVTAIAPTLFDVSATAGNGQATVSWTADDGGSDITGLVLTISGGGYNETETSIDLTEDSYSFTGLDNGTEYTIRVQATNDQGSVSESVTVTPKASGSGDGSPSTILNQRVNSRGQAEFTDKELRNASSLTVSAPFDGERAQLKLGRQALRELDVDDELIVTLRQVIPPPTVRNMPAEQLLAAAEVGFEVDGDELSRLSRDFTLILPIEPGREIDTALLGAVYIGEDGVASPAPGAKYVKSKGGVVIEASRSGYYAISYQGVIGSNLFDDVPLSRWSAEYIYYLADRGIVDGVGNNLFAPAANVTRAEFVKMLAGVAGADVAGLTCAYSDVGADDWYLPYVAWATAAGVSNGVGDNRFAPLAPITREQMATMIYRFVISQGYELPSSVEAVQFADAASFSAYAVEAIAAMQQAGVINGVGGNRFAPQEFTTREAAAKMLAVTHQLINQ